MYRLLLLLLVSCGVTEGTGDEESTVQNTYPVITTSPEAPPQPDPLMREAVMCCGDLALERIVEAFVSLTEKLVSSDLSLVVEAHTAFIESVRESERRGEIFDNLLLDAEAADLSTIAAIRASFGPISDDLIGMIREASSASGKFDLAVGYSRDADHHWVQVGVEPQSPYGDEINSYSWGTREAVQLADAAREIEMGNTQFGAPN